MSYKTTEVQVGDDAYRTKLATYASSRAHGVYGRTIYVALGGTGAKSILHLRRLLMERFGSVDELKGIAFLSMDTDTSSSNPPAEGSGKADPFGERLKFREFERIDLKAQITGLISQEGLMRNAHIREWWDPSVNIDDSFPIEKGAGQIRPLGRLTVFANKETIVQKLQAAFARITANDLNTERIDLVGGVRFVIVGSWSGGTGAGTFIDTAAIIRQTFREAQTGITIEGMFAMPDVFKSVEKAFAKAAANGYACLRELNNYRANPFKVTWTASGAEEETNALFDRCILFSGQNYVGQTLARVGDCYRAIGESLFLDYSAGPLSAWIEGVRVNRKQYLASFTSWPYVVRLPGGQVKEASSERLYTFFSSFGIAKMAAPSWRLLNYARFDLAAEMVGFLDAAREGGGKAVTPMMLKQFMFDLGVFQGTRRDDDGVESSHWQVRDRLFELRGADGARSSVKAAIDEKAAAMIDAAESMFADKTTKPDCDRYWRDTEKLIGDPRAAGQEGDWIKAIRKNREAWVKEVMERLPVLVERYRKMEGMGPSGVDELLKQVLETLDRNHEQEKYSKWFSNRVAVEEADRAEAEGLWRKRLENAVQAQGGWGSKVDNHRAAVAKAAEPFTRYFQARVNIELCSEAVSGLAQVGEQLRRQRDWLTKLSESLSSLKSSLMAYRDFYKVPEPSAMILEIQVPENLDRLLEPYLTAQPEERARRLGVLQEQCMRTLGLGTLEQIKRKVDAEADGLREALATTAFFALKGDNHGKTSAFGEDGQQGFIHLYSAINLLKQNVKSKDELRKRVDELYKRSLPWIGEGSRAKLTDYRPKADAFIGFIDTGNEQFGQDLTNLVKEMRVGDFDCQRVKIEDPSEIIIYTELNAFPAYYGGEVEGMRKHYETLLYNPQKPEPLHIHQDYHEFADPMPAQDGEMVNRTLAWKAFLQAQMLGIIRSVKLRDWDERRIAYQHRVREDGRTAWTDLGPEGAVIRRLERDQLRFAQVIQKDIEAQLKAAVERGFTVSQFAMLADYYTYCVFPVNRPTVMGGAGATEPVGSIANEKARELARDWRSAAQRAGQTSLRDAKGLSAWSVPISRQKGGVVPLTPDLAAESRMEEWDYMSDAIDVVQRMVDQGILREARNRAGQIEMRFPRLAMNMDAASNPTSGAGPIRTQSRPPAPNVAPTDGHQLLPELKLVYQVNDVRQGGGPVSVTEIAARIQAEPASRHRVYHEKAWKDAMAIPEVCALIPVDEIPDDIPEDIPMDNG